MIGFKLFSMENRSLRNTFAYVFGTAKFTTNFCKQILKETNFFNWAEFWEISSRAYYLHISNLPKTILTKVQYFKYRILCWRNVKMAHLKRIMSHFEIGTGISKSVRLFCHVAYISVKAIYADFVVSLVFLSWYTSYIFWRHRTGVEVLNTCHLTNLQSETCSQLSVQSL